jgi:hypothetical protein
MSKKDISLIFNLKINSHKSTTYIYNRKDIKYGYRRIKKLIDCIENFRRADNTFPDDLEE